MRFLTKFFSVLSGAGLSILAGKNKQTKTNNNSGPGRYTVDSTFISITEYTQKVTKKKKKKKKKRGGGGDVFFIGKTKCKDFFGFFGGLHFQASNRQLSAFFLQRNNEENEMTSRSVGSSFAKMECVHRECKSTTTKKD